MRHISAAPTGAARRGRGGLVGGGVSIATGGTLVLRRALLHSSRRHGTDAGECCWLPCPRPGQCPLLCECGCTRPVIIMTPWWQRVISSTSERVERLGARVRRRRRSGGWQVNTAAAPNVWQGWPARSQADEACLLCCCRVDARQASKRRAGRRSSTRLPRSNRQLAEGCRCDWAGRACRLWRERRRAHTNHLPQRFAATRRSSWPATGGEESAGEAVGEVGGAGVNGEDRAGRGLAKEKSGGG